MTKLEIRCIAYALIASVSTLPMSGAWTCAADGEKAKFSPEHIEFFEKHIRPVLIERCFKCHSSDADKVEAGLFVDSRQSLLKGGESGAAIVPGKPDESLLIESIRYESFEMPPQGKLKDKEIANLTRWVEMGAPWPNDGIAPMDVATQGETPRDWEALRQEHWAFRAIRSPEAPPVKNTNWPKGDIDKFILARLEEAKLHPSPAAARRVLIRRTYYDLIGLPPSVEQIDAFIADKRADAYARVIDELLRSPHYGERWGRHWLDVARYSDGIGGFLDNKPLPNAWRYRDWVINALNHDMPIDRFLKMQIAGDLLDADEGAVATGFFALGPTYISDGGDPKAKAQAMSETLDDRVDTLGRGVLGLTVACSRCHDHKFDAIPQSDYYSLAGVFNNSRVVAKSIGAKQELDRYNDGQKKIKDHESRRREREKELKKDGRKLTEQDQVELRNLQLEIDRLKKTTPPKPSEVHALAEGGKADMKIALRGNLLRLGPVAPRRFLRILHGADPARFTDGSGRLELADAIVSNDNPLTARVFVNRVWQHHFGQALVRTPSNFGKLGEKPTHPDLLDWLATRFIQSGWSLKLLHREIMLSSAYQMSSGYDEQSFQADGDNRRLWRMNPRRLDAEAWRDTLLVIGGDLDRSMGGPPHGNITTPRRSVYLQVSRNGDRFQTDEFLHLFDFPAMRRSVSKRTAAAVPQQYLFMMNNDYMLQRAERLTHRLTKEAGSLEEQIELAHRLLFGRKPMDEEKQIALAYIQREDSPNPANLQIRLREYAQALLSSNELMHID